jgi:tRNA/tmRNA/rRNA uracil-C5-methylase (TrmA/RlmC/RlmD family)
MQGDIFEVSIEKLVTGGAGLGRREGEIVFVPGTVPGDRARVRIARRGRSFLSGELVEILEPSPDRAAPLEAPAGALVGADLCYMNLSAQRAAKREIVRDCLLRLGRIDPGERLEEAVPVGPPWGYRNKIRLRLGRGGRYGMYLRGTHEVAPLERSLLMPDAFHEVALPFLHLLPRAPEALVRFDGAGRFLAELRIEEGNPERLAEALLGCLAEVAVPGTCAGILVNGRAVWGEEHLEMKALGRSFRVHAHSFFQVNLAETEGLVATLIRWVEEGNRGDAPARRLLDLYGGVGLFAVSLGARFREVVTVESERSAVRDARENLRRAEGEGFAAEVVSGLVERVLDAWAEVGRHESAGDPGGSVAIVDPPRTGLGAPVARSLAELEPRRIYYVSCDPATLARDCCVLVSSGYEIERIRLFDLFPQTPHVETLTELVRRVPEP